MTGTITRKPSVDVAQEQKPTPIRKGHWRNSYESDRQIVHPIATLGPEPWLNTTRYNSAEIAEQKALEIFGPGSELVVAIYGLRYLGPVFFPEGGEQ